MSKDIREFADFLANEVDLNPSRLERLERGVNGVNTHLKTNLKGYQTMERQGSYATETIIKPVREGQEFDADIQIVMQPNVYDSAKDYIDAIYRSLMANATYADKVSLRTRCITVNYAGDFHLDVVPRVTIKGRHYVCNRLDNEFEPTDGTGCREWFNYQNRISGGNLNGVVRLLKYFRDHKGNYTAKSVLLTTLAGQFIYPQDQGTERVGTVADTFETILTRMDIYLQSNPFMPTIQNPVLPCENFNRHWDQEKYAHFRKMVHGHAKIARKAKQAQNKTNSINAHRRLFGNDFGKGYSSNDVGSRITNPTRAAAPPTTLVRPRKPYA